MATKKNIRYGVKQVKERKVKKNYKLIRSDESVEVLEKEYGEGTIVNKFGKRYYKVSKINSSEIK